MERMIYCGCGAETALLHGKRWCTNQNCLASKEGAPQAEKKPLTLTPRVRGIERCFECSIPIPNGRVFCARHEDD